MEEVEAMEGSGITMCPERSLWTSPSGENTRRFFLKI